MEIIFLGTGPNRPIIKNARTRSSIAVKTNDTAFLVDCTPDFLEQVEREKIEFYTTGIGQPHLIKVSYFPNWKVTGAGGPYLVSPSLMLVIPTQNKVTLYYGMTPANRIGVTLAVSGWVVILLVLVFNLVFYLIARRAKNVLKNN